MGNKNTSTRSRVPKLKTTSGEDTDTTHQTNTSAKEALEVPVNQCDTIAEAASIHSDNADGFRFMEESEMIDKGEIDEESFLDSIPPELQEFQRNQDKIKKIYEECRDFNILFAGLTGSGKSALANAFLGVRELGHKDALKEGDIISKPCTENVEGQTSSVIKPEVGFRVWDTPGFKDGRKHQMKYQKQMACVWSKYHPGDLVIYCIKADTRFVEGKDNPNIKVMINLTKKFGTDFWENAVIVLTFANTLEAMNPTWGVLKSREEKAEKFRSKVQEYNDQIKKLLREDVQLKQDIVDKIKVVPAGHYTNQGLLDRNYWFTTLWFACLDTISAIDQKVLFMYHSRDKMMDESDTRSGSAADRIVLTDDFVPKDLLQIQHNYKVCGALAGLLGGPLCVLTILVGVWKGEKQGEMEYHRRLRQERGSK